MSDSMSVTPVKARQTQGNGDFPPNSSIPLEALRELASWEAASYEIDEAKKKQAPTRLSESPEKVKTTVEPQIRLGGWSGWHRDLWEPQIKDAAKTAGVDLTMEIVEDHWWRGTTYNLVVEGSQEAIDRFQGWYERRLEAWYDSMG